MTWIITADRPVYLQLVEQLELAIVPGRREAAKRSGACRRGGSQPQHDAAGHAGAGSTRPHQHAADSRAYHYGR